MHYYIYNIEMCLHKEKYFIIIHIFTHLSFLSEIWYFLDMKMIKVIFNIFYCASLFLYIKIRNQTHFCWIRVKPALLHEILKTLTTLRFIHYRDGIITVKGIIWQEKFLKVFYKGAYKLGIELFLTDMHQLHSP